MQAQTPGTGQIVPPANPGFTFQEFAPATMQPPPGWPAPPPGTHWPPLPPGQIYYPQPGAAGQPLPPGAYPPPLPAPPKRRRKRTITIVISAVLAGLLIIGGLCFGLSQLVQTLMLQSQVQVQTQIQVNQNTATQLYQQIQTQTPTLQDNLTDKNSGTWIPYKLENSSCTTGSDGLHVQTAENDKFTPCFATNYIPTDFAFQIDMHIWTGDGGGLVWRANGDGENTTFYLFSITTAGTYSITRYQGDNASQVTLTSGKAANLQTGTPGLTNTLTLIVQEDQFYLYLNQAYLTSAQDTTYGSGNIGVIASDSSIPAEVVYTNESFWNLNL